MNATVYSPNSQSPFKIVFGYELLLPIDYAISNLGDCKVYAMAEQI